MTEFKFNAVYQWPIAYSITSESWFSLGGLSGSFNAFALSQDMTNSANRTTVFNQIKTGITASLINPVYLVENNQFTTVTIGLQQFNQWTVNYEGTCEGVNYAIAIAPEYLFTPTTQTNIVYGLGIYPPTITVCDTCQQLTVKACETQYELTTGLTPATLYTVALHAANGNTYLQEITSDANGDITIDAALFPEGAFVPESGGYIVKVYADDSLGTPLTITVGLTQYTCINLNFTYAILT